MLSQGSSSLRTQHSVGSRACAISSHMVLVFSRAYNLQLLCACKSTACEPQGDPQPHVLPAGSAQGPVEGVKQEILSDPLAQDRDAAPQCREDT